MNPPWETIRGSDRRLRPAQGQVAQLDALEAEVVGGDAEGLAAADFLDPERCGDVHAAEVCAVVGEHVPALDRLARQKMRISNACRSATIRFPAASRRAEAILPKRNSSGPLSRPIDSEGSSASAA